MAEQGNSDAQFDPALIYVKGPSVPLHDAEAVKWSRKADDIKRNRARMSRHAGGMNLKCDNGRVFAQLS